MLVRGAAGSIGITTVQLAARRGASAVAVTTSSFLEKLNANAHREMDAGEAFGRVVPAP